MVKHKHTERFITKYRWQAMLIVAFVLTASLLMMQIHSSLTNFSTTEASADENVAAMWNGFPGASVVSPSAVHFAAVERKIVNQDGTGGQPDPAVNVGGAHLSFNGDFTLQLTMAQLENSDASIRLYRDIPIVYDEWRYDGTSVGATLSGQKLIVNIWDGKHDGPASTKTYALDGTVLDNAVVNPPRWQFWRRHNRSAAKAVVPAASTNPAAPTSSATSRVVTFQRIGKQLNILVDNTQVASLSASSLFTKNNLWLGEETTGDGWTLEGMSIGGSASLQNATTAGSAVASTDMKSLANAVRPTLAMGAAVSLYPLMTDSSYRNLAIGQFSMWTPENAMKAQFIHPSKTAYSFEQADLLVDTARKNNITVHGHALVFGEANALWMQSTPASELKAVMEDHITTIMKHYAGKVAEWDVLNEPLADYDTPEGTSGLRKSIWYNAMGESFAADALTTARKADPNAKLYINEFGLESEGDRWDTFVALLKKLQAANVPLDGVGFQAHVYENEDTIDSAVLKSHMEQLRQMGLLSRISEIDVHGEDAAYQAQQYQAVFSACKAVVSCTSFSTWGITDKFGSTTSDHTYPPEYGNDLLWNSNYQPKAAVGALLSALK